MDWGKSYLIYSNKTEGITLIALVVTIVVLLILAGVSISTVLGNNGLLSRTMEARNKTIEAQRNETQEMEDVDSYINESLIDNKKPTDIYATLYSDGTLGFSNNSETIIGKEVLKSYGNIKDLELVLDRNEWTINTPWYEDVDKIETVEIVNEIVPKYMEGFFFSCTQLTEIKNIQNIKTNNVTSMNGLFAGCIILNSLNLSNFNTSNVTDMYCMFNSCSSLQELDLSSFDTSNVTDMSYLFWNCRNLEIIDLTNFDTSKVTNMAGMFAAYDSEEDVNMKLKNILGIEKLNTSNVTDMNTMFQFCTKLVDLDLTNFNTKKVTDMSYMFFGCKGLKNVYLNNFDTSNVTTMKTMFYNCSSLSNLNLKSFNIAKADSLWGMFYNCTNLEKIEVSKDRWVIKEGCNIDYMLDNCGVSGVTKI